MHYLVDVTRWTGLILLTVISIACAKQPRAQNVTLPAGASPTGLAPSTPVEGTISGGGGTGIRCDGKLELLDLWEARRDGLSLIDSPATKLEAVNELAARFGRHYWNPETIPMPDYVASLSTLLIAPILEGRDFTVVDQIDRVRFVDHLDPSDDYGNVRWPTGCRPEPIAYFSDATAEISIVRSAWDELDWLSRMALATHELIYMLERREGTMGLISKVRINNSASTRRFVGHLLSTTPLATKSDGLPKPPDLWRCQSVGAPDDTSQATFLYAFNEAGRLRLILKRVLGHEEAYQLRADFANVTLAQLLDRADGVFSDTAALILVGDTAPPTFTITLRKRAGGDPYLDVAHGATTGGLPQRLRCERL